MARKVHVTVKRTEVYALDYTIEVSDDADSAAICRKAKELAEDGEVRGFRRKSVTYTVDSYHEG